MSAFQMWMVGYHHFKFFPNQNFFIKRIFNLVLYKIKFLVLNFKSPLLKKTQFIKLNTYFLNFVTLI